MVKKHRLTEKDLDAIKRSWKRDGNLAAAAEQRGMTQKTLRKLLQRLGVRSPNGGHPEGETSGKVLAYVKTYRAENDGESPYLAQIGRELGITRQAAFAHVKKLKAKGLLDWGGDAKV